MESAEIARRFLAYFKQQGHTIVPSASLVADDPTVLFVIAGMQPFKPYLLGQQTPPHRRVADVQKCVRTLDIEEVGKTTRHATFFQMLGNWSFGDYFKEGAIRYAWELLTKSEADGGFGFPESKLWATVLHGDDEAFAIWRDQIGLPEDRIQERGLADNYWSMGVPGPGGPCSEIYYDRGPDYGRDGGPEADEDRFLEVWNLVFMQDQLSKVRAKDDFDIEGPLPSKNVDTGMGLERMASILQGVDNLYEIDTTWKILDRAAELTEQSYGRDHKADVALRVIADHVRSAVMLIEDGVLPGNEGRGYVLRRIMRRSIRNLRLLAGAQRGGGGHQEHFIHDLTSVAIEAMAPQYPELRRDAANIHTVMDAEEAAFGSTLRTGTAIFEAAVEENRRKSLDSISGAQAFQLHDTYGFPIDLTLEMATEQGLSVDEDGFRRLMAEQKDRARRDAAEKKTGNVDISVFADLLERSGSVAFTGYDQISGEATVLGLLVDGVPVNAAGAGTELDVVLDRTPFYAEGGGQLADAGVITVDSGVVDVSDVQTPLTGLVVHRGKVRSGEITHRRARARGDRHRAAPGPVPVAHRDPPRAPRAAQRAGGVGGAGGLGELARPAPVRLHRLRGGPAERPAGQRGRGQRGPGQRPGRARLLHHPGGSPRDGGAGPVRGEVRRPGPGGRGRRLLPGAVRRHARGPLRPARPGQGARRGVDRVGSKKDRGPRGPGRVPLPGPGERAGQPAQRAAQGAPRAAARAHLRRADPAPGRRA